MHTHSTGDSSKDALPVTVWRTTTGHSTEQDRGWQALWGHGPQGWGCCTPGRCDGTAWGCLKAMWVPAPQPQVQCWVLGSRHLTEGVLHPQLQKSGGASATIQLLNPN